MSPRWHLFCSLLENATHKTNAKISKCQIKCQKRKNIFQKGIDKHPKMEYNRGRKNKRKAAAQSPRVKGRYYGSYEENKIERSRRT